MRTFIAIDLDSALKRPILRLLQELPRINDVKWATANQLHLTLKFLGDVPDAQIAKVCEIAREVSANLQPFPLRISGLGCFPSPRNPRVLWCGVEDATGTCQAWIGAADPLFEELNFKPETRGFTPHFTLGRSRASVGSDGLRKVFERVALPPTSEMTVRQGVVFESRLLPGGAQYRVVAQVGVGSA